MARAHFTSLIASAKKQLARRVKRRETASRVLETLEDRRVLALFIGYEDVPYGCECECPCGDTGSAAVNNQTGNIRHRAGGPGHNDMATGSRNVSPGKWATETPTVSVHNSSSNPHPIIRVPTTIRQSIAATDFLRLTLTIHPDPSNPQPSDPQSAALYLTGQALIGADEGSPASELLFTFQVDASSLTTTGRYKTSVFIEYFHSGGESDPFDAIDEIPSETMEGPEVNILKRTDSEFGNRWGFDGLDQVYYQSGANSTPRGALLVEADGRMRWYPESGGVFGAAAGDPEFATLTLSSGVYTHTTRGGLVRTFTAAKNGKIATRTDADGNQFVYVHGNSSPYLIEKITDPAGRDTTFAFSSNRLQTVTDFLNRVTNYNYESRTLGNGGTTYVLTSIQYPDPDGSGPLPRPETNYSYTSYDYDNDLVAQNDFDWLLTSIKAPESPGSGQERPTTRFTYDFAGRASTIVHPDGSIDSYDSVQVESLPHPGLAGSSFSNAAAFTFLSSAIEGHSADRGGGVTDFTMDRFGYATSSTDAAGYTTTYTRNAHGQVETIVEEDPDGAGIVFPGSITTTLTYNGSNDLTSISWTEGTDNRSRSFTYKPDGSHRLETVTDELGRVTKYGYHGSGRTPVYIQQFVGTEDSLSYNSTTGAVSGDTNDLVWSFLLTTAANAIPAGLVAKAYDPMDRMTTYDYYSSSEKPSNKEFWGQLQTITLPLLASGESAAPKVDYDYDANGFLKSITESGQSVSNRVTEYLNDAYGRILQVTLPDPGPDNAAAVYRNFYDGFGRLVAAVDPAAMGTAGTTAPSRSPSSVTVNAVSDALYTEIDLTQYFSDDVDGDLALTYVVTGNSNATIFDAVRLPAGKPGTLVLDHKKDITSASADITVHAIDTDSQVSSTLTITVNIGASEEFRINSGTTNSQRRPTIASLPDGGFVAVWMEQAGTGAGSSESIVARIMNADGSARSSDIVVQSGVEIATTSQYPPAVTVTEDGVIVVAWYHLGASDYDVFFRRYNLDGTAADGSAQALATGTGTNNDQYVPVLAALPKQGFVAAWYGGYFGVTAADVFYRRFNSDGTAIDAQQVTVNTTPASGQFRPSIAVGGDGFLVSWQGNGSGDSYGVFARKFDRTGVAFTAAEQRLNTAYTNDLQWDTDAAALADGTYVVVWQGDIDPSAGVSTYEVFYRRVDADGVAIGTAETQVNTSSGYTEDTPKVTALPEGGFVAAWHRPDASGQGIFSRTFDSTYTPVTGETAVNATTSGNQYFTDVITYRDGSLIFAWEGSGTGDSAGVFGRFFPADFAVSGAYRVTNLELAPVVRGKINYAIVSFSEPINSGSIATGDFTLTPPGGGSVSVTSAAALSRTQALVGFSSYASAVGTYTLTVATTITRVSDSTNLGSSFAGTFFRTDMPTTSYLYDAEGRVASVVDALGGRTKYKYTLRGDIASVTDVLGNVTTYAYDERGLLTKVTLPDPDAPGTGQSSPVIQYAYYDDGSLRQVTDATSNVTTYEYDTRHRLSKVTQPGSINTLLSYTKAGELAVVTDPLGRMSTTTYDSLGRVVKSSYLADDATSTPVDQESATRTGAWNTGSPTSDAVNAYGGSHRTASGSGSETVTAAWAFTVEPNKTYEVFVTWVQQGPTTGATNAPYKVYNGTTAGTLLATVPVNQRNAPGDNTVVFSDHGGKWYSIGDFTVTGTTLTVKLSNQANGTVSADAVRIIESSPTKYEYDKNGNALKVTDAMGSVAEQVFDTRNRRTDLYLPHPTTGAGSGSGRPHTSFTFNAFGDLLTLTDPIGNTTTWTPDQLGRTTTEIVVIGGVNQPRTFKYDDAGNLKETVDRLGRVTKYSYDKLYRTMTEKWFADASDSTADRTIGYAFDHASQLTSLTDRDASSNPIAADYEYAYDNLGRVKLSTTELAQLTSSQQVFQQFAYDAMSRRTEAKASIGFGVDFATADYKNTYTYDSLGRLEVLKQQGWGGNTVGEKYVDFDYNALGQFTQIARYDDVDTPTTEIVTSLYGYDNLGRLTSLSHKDVSASNAIRSAYTWKHNANGWLTEMNFHTTWSSENATFAHDKNGQVTGATRGGAGNESYGYDDNGNRNTGSYTTGSDNQLTADGNYTYEYDLEGNLKKRTKNSDSSYVEYAYDHRNRLTTVTSKNLGGSSTQIVRYQYDAFDRRVSKSLDSPPTGSVNRYEFYIWDGDDVVMDFVDADGGIGPNASLDKRYLWGPAVDQLLADETSGNTIHWMLADHQGTIRDLANNNGTLVSGSHVVFDSFGKILSGTLGTRFSYTGQEYDSDTGLYYYNARWYNPGIGKFVSKDPIGFYAGDTNQYRYVGNNAANYTDPSGMQFVDPPFGPGSPDPRDNRPYDDFPFDLRDKPDSDDPLGEMEGVLKKNWGQIFPKVSDEVWCSGIELGIQSKWISKLPGVGNQPQPPVPLLEWGFVPTPPERRDAELLWPQLSLEILGQPPGAEPLPGYDDLNSQDDLRHQWERVNSFDDLDMLRKEVPCTIWFKWDIPLPPR